MTHRERARIALQGGVPDMVPTFELVFHETERDFDDRVFYGTSFAPADESTGLTFKEVCKKNASLYVDVAEKFEHSIIYVVPFGYSSWKDRNAVRIMVEEIRARTGDDYCVMVPGDPTFKIPKDPTSFVVKMYDDPGALKDEARARLEKAVEMYDEAVEMGADGIILTSDYAMNSGPFLTPEQFAEFVTPNLTAGIREIRKRGLISIKHTDGNLMPVIDQIVDAGPDALHSIDPMAGMDIRLIKERYGEKVSLCGNVHTAWLQTGTKEQITDSAEYCLEHGKPGGGYIFCTSNCVFRGMPLSSYDLIHAIWMNRRNY